MNYTVGIFLLLLTQTAIADEPMAMPMSYVKCSKSGGFCVKVKLNSNIQAYKNTGSKIHKDILWEVPGWHRNIFLSNNGVTLVIVYDGQSLIPLKYKQQMVMIKIWKSGVLKYTIRLDSLIDNFSSLERTVSHYQWGDFSGFDKNENFVVSTVENRRLLININTGIVSE